MGLRYLQALSLSSFLQSEHKILSLVNKRCNSLRFFPKYLRKVLSEKLNSYRQYLTVENLCFKDREGNDCPTSSTLVYVRDLKKALDDAICGREIKKPHINIGVDGGGGGGGFSKKIIAVAQIYDLSELDEDNDDDDDDNDDDKEDKIKDKFKSLGAKRTLVIGRGDFAYESRDNIELLYHKLNLFQTMQSYENWHQIGRF